PRSRSGPEPLGLDDQPPRRSPWLWVALAAVVVVMLGGAAGLGYWLLASGSKNDTAETPGEPGGGAVGVAGPRVTLLGKLPDSLKVRHFYIAREFDDPGRFIDLPDTWPQLLPSGTELVYVGVVLEGARDDTTPFDVEMESESGQVELRARAISRAPSDQQTALLIRCAAKKTPFPDGRYKVKVTVWGNPVAELNWAVGKKLPGVDASSLKGTRWRQTSQNRPAERFEFGADGSFFVTSPSGPPGGPMQTGRWQAKGETFTAYVDPNGAGAGRIEYRGHCLKDELW